mgnify:CR=1 FL=1
MIKIIGEELKNIPWQEKPQGCGDVVWRYVENPIIERDAIPSSNSIFNSAVVPFEGKFAGVFRCDSKSRSMDIFAGFSEDGIHWEIEETPIVFEGAEEEILKREYRYDPRVCFIEDRYYITWCNGYHGPTIGIGYTFDFKHFYQLENAFLPYNRNGVLFPRKINGLYGMVSRPSDTGHTTFGDIFYSQSPDLEFWGRHRHVMSTVKGDTSAWQSMKIGAGPVPIETSEGWLLFYHGVFLLSPQKTYECVGDVPNVTFPCAALCDAKTGRIAIYYGCADTVTGLAFAQADELISYIKENSL